MKILVLSKWYPNKFTPQNGVFVRKHCQAIQTINKVTVLHIAGDFNQKKRINTHFTTVNDLPEITIYFKKVKLPVFGKFINFFNYLSSFQAGLKLYKKKNGHPDVILAVVLVRTALLAWWLKFRHKTPYVIMEHWTGYVNGDYKKEWSGFKQALSSYLLKQANAIIVVSESLKKVFSKLTPTAIHIVPNIIDEAESKSTMPFQKEEGSIYFLSVSHMDDHVKNVSGLIKAFVKATSQSKKPIYLHLIGEGDDKIKLEALAASLEPAEKRIFFHGFKTNKEVLEWMQHADVYICNSRTETFSVATAEAIIAGVPAICTACGGPEFFVTETVGKVIDSDNESQLTSAILELSTTYKNYSKAELQNYIRQKFGHQAIAEAFDSIFSNV